jgi:hypothetical protein
MYQLILTEVTPQAGKKSKVVERYRQNLPPETNILELVARLNAPAKPPRKSPGKKAEAPKPAAKPKDGGVLQPSEMGRTTSGAIGQP